MKKQKQKPRPERKSMAARYVLMCMDASEKGPDSYGELIREAVNIYKVDRAKLENELNKYV